MTCCSSITMKVLQNTYVLRLVTYALALYYGATVCLMLAWKFVKSPGKKFWFIKKREITPDCLTDPNRGTHCYAQLKDVKLHYVEKGDKEKPLMLFVHGFPEFWYSWRHQMDEFSKDYWAVAVDMRGYGDSDKPVGTKHYVMKKLVNDIKDLVEFLGRKKFTLVAHDWGGAVAWAFVDTHSDMLDKYVIMDAPRSNMWIKHVFTHWKQFTMSWYIFFYQLPYLPEILVRSYDLGMLAPVFRGDTPKEKSLITDEDIEAYKYTFSKPGALTGPINYYRANVLRTKTPATTDAQDKKLDIQAPGLMIFGEKDKYLDLQFLEMTKKVIEDLTVKVVAGGNHFVQQDVPKTVNKIMREFLKN